MATGGAGEILKSDSNSSFKFNDSLLSLLECPVCMKYMQSPIKQCINGHALCSACKQKVSKCPTCQGEFLDTRILPLENLAEKMQYPCKNVLVGCNRRLAYTEVSEHSRTCVHRLYECLPRRDKGCKWMGRSAMAMDGAGEILKSDSNNPFNFNDSLLSLLECPVCTEYMRSPIKLCINGHALCSACKQKVSKCPTCQGQFLDTRNLSLENLAEKMQYPCENVLVGCNRRLAYTEVSEHRRTCVHRLYECLPGWSEGCKWMGRRSEILAHIETEHGHLVWSEKDNTWSPKMFDFSTTKNFLRVINVNKDIFWFQGRLNADTKKYYIAVQYIGPVENRLNFTYRVEISSKCKNYGYIFKSVTLSDIEDFNDIFDSEVCAVINYGVMEVFLKDESLVYYVSVMKFTQ